MFYSLQFFNAFINLSTPLPPPPILHLTSGNVYRRGSNHGQYWISINIVFFYFLTPQNPICSLYKQVFYFISWNLNIIDLLDGFQACFMEDPPPPHFTWAILTHRYLTDIFFTYLLKKYTPYLMMYYHKIGIYFLKI